MTWSGPPSQLDTMLSTMSSTPSSRFFPKPQQSHTHSNLSLPQQQQQPPLVVSSSAPPGGAAGSGARAGASPTASTPLGIPVDGEKLRTSVQHLLSRAHNLPCSTTAQAFGSLVHESARFKVALDTLLPMLNDDSGEIQIAQRILVVYIIHSIYAPHPITINPFKSVLYTAFIAERKRAVQTSGKDGEMATNEQYVWVLWKILKGDGNDLGPYSPSTLAKSPLPPELRASHLVVDEGVFTESDANSSLQDGKRKLHADVSEKAGPSQDEEFARGARLLLDSRSRTLNLSERSLVLALLPKLSHPSAKILNLSEIGRITEYNPSMRYPLYTSLLTHHLAASWSTASGMERMETIVADLQALPLAFNSFDMLSSMLKDQTPIKDPITPDGKTTIGGLVKREALGGFLSRCIQTVEKAEKEEKEGLISDDRVARYVKGLCMFYGRLVETGIVDATDDVSTAEMKHFSLRYSRFEDANALYRTLAAAQNR